MNVIERNAQGDLLREGVDLVDGALHGFSAGGMLAVGIGPAWRSPSGLLQIALLLPAFVFQSSVEEVMS